MGMTATDLFNKLNNPDATTTQRGEGFEKLIAHYLQTDPTQTMRFKEVVPWDQWEGRTGRDIGIDLIGIEHGGGICAIQCKFYDPKTSLTKQGIDSFLAASGKHPFTSRLIASTTDKWGPNAKAVLDGQRIPITRLGLGELVRSPIDWDTFNWDNLEALTPTPTKTPLPHQRDAVADVLSEFEFAGRTQMVMACGTGKTYTALQIAQHTVPVGGTALFLVPSLALLSQALLGWGADKTVPMRVFAVCSDAQVASRGGEDIEALDLPIPPTTDPERLAEELKVGGEGVVTVVFATYQSLAVIHEAQREGVAPFDLLVADEAHRTTGAAKKGEESTFVLVHDNDYIQAAKRLYMTATPRVYSGLAKESANRQGAVVASMNDETVFGRESHRLNFGNAVTGGLLCDYKVSIFAASPDLFRELAAGNETDTEAAKMVGVWAAIMQTFDEDSDEPLSPLRRVVVFARDIKTSKAFAQEFPRLVEEHLAGDSGWKIEAAHIDGTMNMPERDRLLDWLKNPPENTTRVLCNARLLTEGVDVPALDGIVFLSPRNSQIDVVQAVGRVMRKAEGKDYGHIIIPVLKTSGMSGEGTLDADPSFNLSWQVLQALRSHDERFDAEINQIELNEKKPRRIRIYDADGAADGGEGDGTDPAQGTLDLGEVPTKTDPFTLTRGRIFAHIVKKVGTTRYWETWAEDVAEIADRNRQALTSQLANPSVAAQFTAFLEGLRANLNDGIGEADAIDMLSQHLITRPVFEAVLGHDEFTSKNPVAQVMDEMLGALDAEALDAHTAELAPFYLVPRECSTATVGQPSPATTATKPGTTTASSTARTAQPAPGLVAVRNGGKTASSTVRTAQPSPTQMAPVSGSCPVFAWRSGKFGGRP